MRWSREHIDELAPDSKSVKAALALARPGPWSETGATESLLWGKCQGSGSTPYQVSVDLTGPAVTCTCPSRKFPCKHGLALLYLWVDGDGAVDNTAEAPDDTRAWADARAERAGAGTRGAGTGSNGNGDRTAPPADPQAQARRLEQRLGLMTSGCAELEIWLADLYRQGLAAARQRPYSFWDEAAARLQDAQLPGLAERVRALPGDLQARPDWADWALIETGRWYTAARSWPRRHHLPPDDQANLRAFVGWPIPTEEVMGQPPVDDDWLVAGVHRTDDGRLQAQRTWLRGERSGEIVLILDFAAVGAALGVAHVVGTLISTPVAPYPGTGVRRGLFVGPPTAATTRTSLPVSTSFDEALDAAATSLGANPFGDRHPISLQARVVADEEGAMVVDGRDRGLALTDDVDPWPILARTGPRAVPLFGELEHGRVRPLTIEVDGSLVPV